MDKSMNNIKLIKGLRSRFQKANDDSIMVSLDYIKKHKGECYFEMLGSYKDEDNFYKLYWDIDDKQGKYKDNPNKLLNMFLEKIIDYMRTTFPEECMSITHDDFAVSSSHGQKIVSFHVLLKGFKMLYSDMEKIFSADKQLGIDSSVYSTTRKFRAIGMNKSYDDIQHCKPSYQI